MNDFYMWPDEDDVALGMEADLALNRGSFGSARFSFAERPDSSRHRRIDIQLFPGAHIPQEEVWCTVHVDGGILAKEPHGFASGYSLALALDHAVKDGLLTFPERSYCMSRIKSMVGGWLHDD